MQFKFSSIFFLSILIVMTKSINKVIGKTPPMGWNSLSSYGCSINETIIKNTVNKLIQLGLSQKGYSYVNIDDCWQQRRNQTTDEITEDFGKFPNGIENLSKYIHSKGLKFGLSSDSGVKTCQGKPGSFGYQKIDALKYAYWEIDYLKYDNCFKPENSTAKLRYYVMSKALNQTGRQIFFSLSCPDQTRVWQWGATVGNSWRTTNNILPNWESIVSVLQKQVGLEKFAVSGGWNDIDVLQIGNANLTYNEQYAHFTFWCILKAPLIIGSNIMTLSQQNLQILTNQELIAINQDSLNIQGRRIKSQIGSAFKREVWGGPLSNNQYVVVFFNRGQNPTTINIFLRNDLGLDFISYTQRDPIRRKNIGITNKDILQQENVAAHSVEVRVLTLIKEKNIIFQ